MKNISELPEVIVADMDVKEEIRQDSEGKDYKVNFIEVNKENYRIPYTVLAALKAILEKKPDLQKFAVDRQGTTKEDTRYTVIPL